MNQIQMTEGETYLCRFHEILDQMKRGMTGAELSCSISHNFIVQMIPHHEAAVEMSKNILEYTDWEPLRTIAENIIKEQTQGIAEMKRILDRCGLEENSRQALCQYQRCIRSILDDMFSEMQNAPKTCCLNRDFIMEMLPHHMGAIRMSRNALKFTICSELRPILENIIATQSQGVREMERLLQRLS